GGGWQLNAVTIRNSADPRCAGNYCGVNGGGKASGDGSDRSVCGHGIGDRVAVQSGRENLAASRCDIRDCANEFAIKKQIRLLQGMQDVCGRELDGQRLDSSQGDGSIDAKPATLRSAAERSRKGFCHYQALVRFADALIITFGDRETAALVEIVLWERKFLEYRGRLRDGAIAAASPGGNEGQRRRVIVRAKNNAAIGSQAVGHSARDETVRGKAELGQAGLKAEQIGLARG